MKKVEAIIRPMRLEAVKAALAESGEVVGMTVSDVRGFGRPDESIGAYSGQNFNDTLAPKILLEMVVADDQVQEVIDLVIAYARTGAEGDGKIFVTDLDDAVRIRTGDRGDIAVS